MSSTATFKRYGANLPAGPILLSVPHAGRDYPLALQNSIRVPLRALQILEDRYVDAVAVAARRNETLFVAERARAWIDLNRAEDERDPRLDDGARIGGAPLSIKLRSGLGLVPRRITRAGDFWSRRLSGAEVEARIASDHRPYHEALAEGLQSARERFGVAVLLDIHSMPPLTGNARQPHIVIGDRFGRAAGANYVKRVESVLRSHNILYAKNAPYAGGHILDRQSNPRRGIHAIQLEIDRSLYLDSALDGPGPGMPAVIAIVRQIIDALADEALPAAMAAE